MAMKSASMLTWKEGRWGGKEKEAMRVRAHACIVQWKEESDDE